jgi:flavin reductase (DIM6/NTAB) family NADH-FMN oxidoreductase RutF
MGAGIDVKQFWKTLGTRATGMTIVTARGGSGPAGFVGLSAAHVSADPPTMLVSLDRKTSALAPVLESRHFAINYLAKGQEAIGDIFGRRTADYAERFSSPDWTTLETGAPVLSSALGAFDCALERIVETPSTVNAIGKVVGWFARDEGEPLIFFRGKYLG